MGIRRIATVVGLAWAAKKFFGSDERQARSRKQAPVPAQSAPEQERTPKA